MHVYSTSHVLEYGVPLIYVYIHVYINKHFVFINPNSYYKLSNYVLRVQQFDISFIVKQN